MLPFRLPFIRDAHTRRHSLPIRLEGAQPASAPADHEISRARAVVATILELTGEFEKRPQQRGAIVIDKLDEAGLLDEAAEFDQMAGAGAAVLHPLPLVVTCPIPVQPVTQHGQMI